MTITIQRNILIHVRFKFYWKKWKKNKMNRSIWRHMANSFFILANNISFIENFSRCEPKKLASRDHCMYTEMKGFPYHTSGLFSFYRRPSPLHDHVFSFLFQHLAGPLQRDQRNQHHHLSHLCHKHPKLEWPDNLWRKNKKKSKNTSFLKNLNLQYCNLNLHKLMFLKEVFTHRLLITEKVKNLILIVIVI